MNILGKGTDSLRQHVDSLRHGFLTAGIVGILQVGIGVGREFGVDRQPYRLIVLPRQLDRKLDDVLASRHCRDVGCVLFRGQNFFQDRAQLDFPDDAAGLDVGQHFFQIADADGQRLHFAQSLIDLFQTIVNELERLRHLVLQRLLQLFIDSLPHFIQFPVIVLLDRGQLFFNRLTHVFQFLLVPGFKGFQAVFQHAELIGHRCVERILLFRQRLADLGEFPALQLRDLLLIGA